MESRCDGNYVQWRVDVMESTCDGPVAMECPGIKKYAFI
jgi:hypothetical protein